MMTETLHFKELGEFGVVVEKKVREAEMCLKGWLLYPFSSCWSVRLAEAVGWRCCKVRPHMLLLQVLLFLRCQFFIDCNFSKLGIHWLLSYNTVFHFR